MLSKGKRTRLTSGAVQSIDSLTDTTRRTFLRTVAVQAVALPAASVLVARSNPLAAEPSNTASALAPHAPDGTSVRPIVREFADPWLELVRLLREAAEIEDG